MKPEIRRVNATDFRGSVLTQAMRETQRGIVFEVTSHKDPLIVVLSYEHWEDLQRLIKNLQRELERCKREQQDTTPGAP